jgi:hypothetical protein
MDGTGFFPGRVHAGLGSLFRTGLYAFAGGRDFGAGLGYAGGVTFHLEVGLTPDGVGASSQFIVLGTAASDDAADRTDDKVIDDRQGDQEINQLNQEGYVDIDHYENLQPKL